MSEHDQPDAVEHRLRFFDGQYLNHLDLVDEQKYHIDRGRRLGRTLRVVGVVDGMEVSATGTDQVTVAPGTALDAEGRYVVLAEPRAVAIPQAFRGRQVRLLLGYRELPALLADEVVESARGHRRWHESPQIVTVADDQQSEDWAEPGTSHVELAQLTVDGSGRVTIDRADLQPAGMRVPGDVHAVGELRVGRGTGLASLTAGDRNFSLRDRDHDAVLTVDQASGHVVVGDGSLDARARMDVGPPDGGDLTQAALHLRNGDDLDRHDRAQISFGWRGGAQHRHVVRTRHNGTDGEGNAVDFFTWNPATDAADTPGTRHALTIDNGKVGIGTITPRTGLDTGTNVMSGAAVDYAKAQSTLVGGGHISWRAAASPADAPFVLRWSTPFVALGATPYGSFPDGHISIAMPGAEIPGDHVWNGKPRRLWNGTVPLDRWEILYAVHPGASGGRVTLRIASGRHPSEVDPDPDDGVFTAWRGPATREPNAPTFVVASNWIVLAAVNGNDRSVRLGVGRTLTLGSTYPEPAPPPAPPPVSPVLRGTIVMWSGTAIPEGWVLCDGQNGTPNLAGRFIQGAHPALSMIGLAVGNSGTTQHSHEVLGYTAGASRIDRTSGADNVRGWHNLYFIMKT